MKNFIAPNLRLLLATTNTKQSDLAKAIDIDGTGTVSAWINERSSPSAIKIQAICAFFGISVDDFMNYDLGQHITKRLNKKIIRNNTVEV